MTTLNGDLSAILTDIDNILSVCSLETTNPNTKGTDRLTLAQALEQLADVMTHVENDAQPDSSITAEDITEIGAYALQLQEALAATCKQQALVDQTLTLARLASNMALWISRHDGRIESLEAVADGIAQLANHSRDPVELGELSAAISDIIPAVSDSIRQDLEKMNPGRPWRVLLLNHGIVATRSHDPARMETAFSLLTEQLPEEAGQFFNEGIQQINAADYPAPAREVMEKYHHKWPVNQGMH